MTSLKKLIESRYLQKIEEQFYGEKKLYYLKSNTDLIEFLVNKNFNGYHLTKIFGGKEWKEKIEWTRDNFESILKSKGFTPYHTSQILRGKEWVEKTKWIKDNYNPSEYTQKEVQLIMEKREWKGRLKRKIRKF